MELLSASNTLIQTWSNVLIFLLDDFTFDSSTLLNLLSKHHLCFLPAAKHLAGTQPEPEYSNNSNKDGNKPIYPQEFSQEFINSISPCKRHS